MEEAYLIDEHDKEFLPCLTLECNELLLKDTIDKVAINKEKELLDRYHSTDNINLLELNGKQYLEVLASRWEAVSDVEKFRHSYEFFNAMHNTAIHYITELSNVNDIVSRQDITPLKSKINNLYDKEGSVE